MDDVGMKEVGGTDVLEMSTNVSFNVNMQSVSSILKSQIVV